MDGKGYPKGLTREQMSVQARIMGIADIFEALTAKDRPYKPGKTLSESLAILGKLKENGHIDPDLFDIFVRDKVYLRYAREFLDPEQIDEVDLVEDPRLLPSSGTDLASTGAIRNPVLSPSMTKRMPVGVFFALFTVSGFAGLIYESIWSHYLKLFLGHAAYAQTLVLAIFMGGMALGSWLVSRYTGRIRNLLVGYAAAEFGIGVLAITFHGLFNSVTGWALDSVLPALGGTGMVDVVKWAIASALILPASLLLGTTFPLMSAGVIRLYPDSGGRALAMLYFTNSLGAAIGVLASGFLLIAEVGLPGTILTAGILNITLALVVWAWRSAFPSSAQRRRRVGRGAGRLRRRPCAHGARARLRHRRRFVHLRDHVDPDAQHRPGRLHARLRGDAFGLHPGHGARRLRPSAPDRAHRQRRRLDRGRGARQGGLRGLRRVGVRRRAGIHPLGDARDGAHGPGLRRSSTWPAWSPRWS